MSSSNCAKCGSTRVTPDAVLRDQNGGTVTLCVYRHPDALIFGGPVLSTLHARVCANCGYTELYAQDGEALYQAHCAAAGRSEVSF